MAVAPGPGPWSGPVREGRTLLGPPSAGAPLQTIAVVTGRTEVELRVSWKTTHHRGIVIVKREVTSIP